MWHLSLIRFTIRNRTRITRVAGRNPTNSVYCDSFFGVELWAQLRLVQSGNSHALQLLQQCNYCMHYDNAIVCH